MKYKKKRCITFKKSINSILKLLTKFKNKKLSRMQGLRRRSKIKKFQWLKNSSYKW